MLIPKELKKNFIDAVYRGKPDEVESIIKSLSDEEKKELVDARDKNYNIPIILAAKKGNLEMVKLLVESGANINAQDTYSKSTALHLAIENRHYDVVKYIVNIKSVNLESRNRDDNTPIILAAEKGNLEMVKLLVESGADFDAKNKVDSTAIMYAARVGKWEIVELLAKKDAYLEPRNKCYFTPIMEAALAGKWGIVMFLAKKGAYLESHNEAGDTPIIRASKAHKLGTVKLLAEKGANINAKNEAGNTAIMYAARAGNLKMVKLLLEHSANPSITDKSGRTPLDIAILFDRSEDIVSLLEEAVQKQLNEPSEAIEKPNTDFTGLIDPQQAKNASQQVAPSTSAVLGR